MPPVRTDEPTSPKAYPAGVVSASNVAMHPLSSADAPRTCTPRRWCSISGWWAGLTYRSVGEMTHADGAK